jgi:hypothetical protein
MGRIGSLRIAVCLGIVFACGQNGNGTLIEPIYVTSSTADTDLWMVRYLIGGEGLIGSYNKDTLIDDLPAHGVVRDDNSWVTKDRNGSGDYFATGDKPFLTFKLDGRHALDRMVLWNYAGDGNAAKNGVSAMTVDFSLTGDAGSFTGGVALNNIAVGSATEHAQVLSFGRQYSAQYVRLTLTDNFYDAMGGGDRVGLSEVMFSAPEPSSRWLLVICLLGVGLFALRRKTRIVRSFPSGD